MFKKFQAIKFETKVIAQSFTMGAILWKITQKIKYGRFRGALFLIAAIFTKPFVRVPNSPSWNKADVIDFQQRMISAFGVKRK